MLLWTHVQVLVWLHGPILISLRIYWGVELLGHVVTTTSKARGLPFLCILASTCCLSSWLQLPWAKWHLPGALTCISLMTDDAERPSCVSTSWALLSLPPRDPIPILSAQLQPEMATASFSPGLSPSNLHVHAVFVIIKLNFALSSSHICKNKWHLESISQKHITMTQSNLHRFFLRCRPGQKVFLFLHFIYGLGLLFNFIKACIRQFLGSQTSFFGPKLEDTV